MQSIDEEKGQRLMLCALVPLLAAALLLPPPAVEPAPLTAAAWQAPPYDGAAADARWHDALEAFARSDREHPVAPGGVVFLGSSSIGAWPDLERRFGTDDVVRRGFGGSLLADSARHASTLVVPLKPRLVVVYAGDNDLAEGATPQQVLARYVELVGAVHARLPETRIAFISIKPSPSRLSMMGKVIEANQLVAQQAQTDARLEYIDIYSSMLDAGGRPRRELYLPDGLHPSAAGYAIWHAAVAPHLARPVVPPGRG